MLFHTLTFFLFFAAFLCAYIPCRSEKTRMVVILAASNIFYGWWNWKFLALLWLTIWVDYAIGCAIGGTQTGWKRKFFLIASVSTNLAILAGFKYYNFFVAGASALKIKGSEGWYIENLVIPVGLSFYTFQSMSYVIDVFRGKLKPEKNLLNFAAFVCYFPQLVAGPIERVAHLLPQLLRPAPITHGRIFSGLLLFSFGFLRKGFADVFGGLIDPVFADISSTPPFLVLLSVFGFGLQIYLDFTGYVDMARGISRVLGIDLMVNFHAPYLATSIREFWRRWHISLSEWLRDYLYIPLGGNRHGLVRQTFSLMLTMVLGGFWHGAGVNFLIWGGLHGVYLVINTLWERWLASENPSAPRKNSSSQPLWRWMKNFSGWLITFLAVNYAWLYFRAPNLEAALSINKKIMAWLQDPTISVPGQFPVGVLVIVIIVVAMEFVINSCSTKSAGALAGISQKKLLLYGFLAGLMAGVGLILHAGNQTQKFIYFQF